MHSYKSTKFAIIMDGFWDIAMSRDKDGNIFIVPDRSDEIERRSATFIDESFIVKFTDDSNNTSQMEDDIKICVNSIKGDYIDLIGGEL